MLAGGVSGPTALVASVGSLWVSDTSGDVRRLDPRTRRVTAVTHVGGYPESLAVDGTSVWVATIAPGVIVRVSRTTNRRVGRILQVGNGQPLRIAVGGRTLWIVNAGDERVWRVDAGSGRIEGSTVVTPAPWLSATVTADPDGCWVAFYTSPARSTLVHLDPSGRITARRQVARVEIGVLATTHDLVLAAGSGSGLLRLDSHTGRPRAPAIPVGRDPIALAVARDGVWVSSLGARRAVREVDVRSGRTLVRPVRAPGRTGRADDLALAGGYLWATNAYGIVSRLDPATGRVRGASLPVP